MTKTSLTLVRRVATTIEHTYSSVAGLKSHKLIFGKNRKLENMISMK